MALKIFLLIGLYQIFPSEYLYISPQFQQLVSVSRRQRSNPTTVRAMSRIRIFTVTMTSVWRDAELTSNIKI